MTQSRDEDPRAALARCKALVDHLAAGVVVYAAVDDGQDFVVVELNRAAAEIGQVERQAAVGRRLSELYPKAEEIGLLGALRRVWRTGAAERLSTLGSSDRRLAGHRELQLWKLSTDEVAALFEDPSLTRQAEEDLRQSENRFRRLVENLRREYFFYSHDREGVFQYLSPSITDILGYSVDEYLTNYDVYFTDNPINEAARHHTERSIAGEQQEPYELEIAHKQGGVRLFEVIEVPVRGPDGEVALVEGIAHDITSKRVMEQELLKVQKLEALGVLAGGIAHDFNNLLTVILSNLSLVDQAAGLPDEERQDLADALQAATQARHLTQQLLTFSRGGMPVRRKVVLKKLIHEAVGLATRGSNVTTDLRLDPVPPVKADPGQIHQVLSNICINAVQAMPNGGEMTVTTDLMDIDYGSPLPLDPGPYVRVRLQDSGPGIPAEHLTRIFDPYFSTKEAGTGLGLTVCYSVMRNHGGHLVVHSPAGQGAAFDIYLPAPADVHSPRHPPEAPAPSGEGRILVMDDDAAILRVATRMLQRFGYTVTAAEEGGRAVELYRTALDEGRPFDLVILDLTVPGGLGGRETLARLRELDPEVKAIVSSGYSNDPVMADYRAHGFTGVLTKPYARENLQAVLAQVEGAKP